MDNRIRVLYYGIKLHSKENIKSNLKSIFYIYILNWSINVHYSYCTHNI